MSGINGLHWIVALRSEVETFSSGCKVLLLHKVFVIVGGKKKIPCFYGSRKFVAASTKDS